MKKVIVASKNPVKLNSSLSGFQRMFLDETFEIEGVSVPSGVADQPMNDAETIQGAYNRAHAAAAAYPDADYWVGMEGGIEERDGGMTAFAWTVIKSKTQIGKAKTGTFFLPKAIADLIRQGTELGKADDIVFARSNSKQENGAVGLMTGNVIDRTRFYADSVVLALIPFKNEDLYAPLQSDS